jgi:hypothetical protein
VLERAPLVALGTEALNRRRQLHRASSSTPRPQGEVYECWEVGGNSNAPPELEAQRPNHDLLRMHFLFINPLQECAQDRAG